MFPFFHSPLSMLLSNLSFLFSHFSSMIWRSHTLFLNSLIIIFQLKNISWSYIYESSPTTWRYVWIPPLTGVVGRISSCPPTPQESCPPALGVSQEDEVRPRADCTSFSLREIAFSGTLLISDGLAGPGGAPWAAPLQLPPAPRLADGPENCVPYLGADSRCAWAPWHFSWGSPRIDIPPSIWPTHVWAAYSLGVCALKAQPEVLSHLFKEVMELLQTCNHFFLIYNSTTIIYSFIRSFIHLFIWLYWVLVVARRIFSRSMRTLSCSMWTLSCGMHVGSSPLIRDRTWAPCTGSAES